MTSFIVRRLGPGDEAVLQAWTRIDDRFELEPDDGRPSVPLDDAGSVAFLADPTVLLWFAEVGSRPIGMLLCYVQRRRAAGAWAELNLYEIGTDIDWRRRGVGRALLDAMRRWMADNGVREVWVPSAPEAVPFYEACGFTRDEGTLLTWKAPGR